MVSSGTGIVANGNAILATGSSVAGGNVYGVALSGGGTVLNFTNSVISAASAGYGVFVSQNTGSVTNQGLIIDTARAGFGVALAAGGTVTNEPGAAIVADNGVWLRGGPGTVSSTGRSSRRRRSGSASICRWASRIGWSIIPRRRSWVR